MWEGGVIMWIFRMCSNLTCYQLKIDWYIHRLIYVSLMVTTKQKPIVSKETQNITRIESKHNTKESHQTTQGESKKRRKEHRVTTK